MVPDPVVERAPATNAPRPEPAAIRLATIGAFFAVGVASLAVMREGFRRADVAEDYLMGAATLSEVDHADRRVLGMLLISWLVQLAAAILLAIWTYLTCRTAARRYPVSGVRPVLAALAWFIPILHFFLPWRLLHEAAAKERSVAPPSLGWWRFLYFAQMTILFVGSRLAFPRSGMAPLEVVDAARKQGIVLLVVSVLLFFTAVAAASAMRRVDRCTSGTAALQVNGLR